MNKTMNKSKTDEETLLKSTGLFRVASLKWEKNYQNDYAQSWWASVPMGSYRLDRNRESPDLSWGQWRLRWCFDEYYDEDEIGVESLADGKRKAWSNWMERLAPALIQAEQTPNN